MSIRLSVSSGLRQDMGPGVQRWGWQLRMKEALSLISMLLVCHGSPSGAIASMASYRRTLGDTMRKVDPGAGAMEDTFMEEPPNIARVLHDQSGTVISRLSAERGCSWIALFCGPVGCGVPSELTRSSRPRCGPPRRCE